MRSSRFIAILVAFMLAAVVSPLSSAQATTDDGVYAKARTAHVLKKYDAGEIRNSGRFFVKGAVVTYPNKFVKLQKKRCLKCAWKPVKQGRTGKSGSFRMEFDGPRGTYFRIFVPGTSKYKPLYKVIGKIVAG